MAAPKGRIALLRHGETEWSRSGQHTSVTDLDLTDRGVRQAQSIPALLTALDVKPVAVLVSPRLRAQRTASLAGLSTTDIDDDLAEWSYGEYEGITSKQIHQTRPGWSIFTDGAPGGESPAEVGARADRVLDRAAALLTDGDVILVGHGHMSRVLAARWCGFPVAAGAALTMDAAAVTLLGFYHDDRAIERLNVPAELARSEQTGPVTP
ncbi:histidine phosphatase family protein [Nakamurella aerolata]|uniref:Histidine phosphatase family protein n=1 Tax=Nakamurella aerolata TaxID=1656892 RepID=A0A849AAM0_9ACTN|nr:histidine phosphatase family protein [Nakamurella aerolata]NNG36636.1 histidine phosphatase family protein [Nakamurella aerolata]